MDHAISAIPAPADQSAIPNPFLARLRESLGRRFGDPESWRIEVATARGGTSGRGRSIFRACELGSGRSVAIKAHDSKSRNRREFRALQSLHRHAPDSVAPLYIARDARFFAMEWMDAPLLSDRLDGPDRAALVARAGAWLARLHAETAGPKPPGPHRRPAMGLPLRNGDGAIGLATSRLRARMRAVSPKAGPRAVLHGDFHAGNFFAAEGRIVAFDREYDTYGLTFVDIAKFLADIAARRVRAAAEGRPWSGDAESDRRCFFEGYGPLPPQDVALYDAIEDFTVFRIWRRQIRQGSHIFDDAMHRRSLLGPEDTDGMAARPGRLIATLGGQPEWSDRPATAPQRGLARLRTRLA